MRAVASQLQTRKALLPDALRRESEKELPSGLIVLAWDSDFSL